MKTMKMRRKDKLDRWRTVRTVGLIPFEVPFWWGMTPYELNTHSGLEVERHYRRQGPQRKAFRDAVRAAVR